MEEITHIREENIAKLERIRMLSAKQTTSLCSHPNIAATVVLEKQIINQDTIRRQLTEASNSSNYTNKSSNKEDFVS